MRVLISRLSLLLTPPQPARTTSKISPLILVSIERAPHVLRIRPRWRLRLSDRAFVRDVTSRAFLKGHGPYRSASGQHPRVADLFLEFFLTRSICRADSLLKLARYDKPMRTAHQHAPRNRTFAAESVTEMARRPGLHSSLGVYAQDKRMKNRRLNHLIVAGVRTTSLVARVVEEAAFGVALDRKIKQR